MPALKPETAIRKLVIDDAGISALISSRVYPDVAPEKSAFPFVVYERISTDVQHDMGGAGNLKYVRVGMTIYSYSPDERNTIAEAIEALLDGNRDTVTISASSIRFQTLFLEDQQDQVLKPDDGKGRAIYQALQTYFVAYSN